MRHHLTLTGICVAVAALATGCASPYRTSSNVPASAAAAVGVPATQVLLAEGNLPGRRYKEIGPVEVSVKKATLFHKDPTRDQANEALTERARVIGADAVINITYTSGVGMTTWGYMDAKGMGGKLLP